jgi:peptidoglycan/xylan/chitin deacetylase (PgdA/CDA1 family)
MKKVEIGVVRFGVIVAVMAALVSAGPAAPKDSNSTAQQTMMAVDYPANDADKFWQHAKREVDKSVLEMIAQNQAELARGAQYHKFMHGSPNLKEIAITFDDGPHPQYTPRLLDILKQYDVRATFFVVGEKAEESPNLIRAEIAGGHSVGNHTYHHVSLTKIPEEYVPTEIKACGEVLKSITGKSPHLFRPPGGDYDQQVAVDAGALGYTTVLWTDDPGDYASPGDKVIKSRLLDRISNGGIVLIHDGVQQTVDVLPGILGYLKSRGYKFVTVDEMMAHSGARP